MAELLAERVQEWVENEPETEIGEMEEGMRQLLQAVGKRALGKSISGMLFLDVSDNTIRKETQRVGQRRAEQEEEWHERSQRVSYLDTG